MNYRQFSLLVEQNNLVIQLLAEIAVSQRAGGGPTVDFYRKKIKEFESTLEHLDPDSGMLE